MGTFDYKGKSYEVDSQDFLRDFQSWDGAFAEGMAQWLRMPEGLTKEQWDVINFIRDTYKATGRCPNIYETCRMCGLRLNELRILFPTGYLRGACRLAGVTYKEGSVGQRAVHYFTTGEDVAVVYSQKTYQVDVRGFLVNPDDWDEQYAINRAYDLKIPGGKLTDRHWQIIMFLRKSYEESKRVPNVYETCEKNAIDVDELERLFPDGYHRGAVRIAGLRVR